MGFFPEFKRAYILKKATARINGVLDRLGEDNLRYLLENDKDLLPLLSPQHQQALSGKVKQYAWAKDVLTRQVIWQSVDGTWRDIILSYPNGEKWALRQIEALYGLV